MAFKHDDARNSAVYRSFEKIAYDKGLISKDQIHKTASTTKQKFKPTNSLMENVLLLCAGLRSNGLIAQANDLEQKFLMYKSAASTSEVDPEIMQQAHPSGSTRVSNISDEAVVEDALEAHLKMVDVAIKPPQIRLTTASEVLHAVKIAIAQDFGDDIRALNAKLGSLRDKVLQTMFRMHSIIETEGNMISGSYSRNYRTAYVLLEKTPIKEDNILSAMDYFKRFKNDAKPGILGGAREDAWSQIEQQFPVVEASLNEMLKLRKEINRLSFNSSNKSLNDEKELPKATVPYEEKPSNQIDKKVVPDAIKTFENEVNNALSNLRKWEAIIENNTIEDGGKYGPSSVAAAKKWINDKRLLITGLKEKFEKYPDDLKNELSQQTLQKLRNLTWKEPGSFETFRKTWIG